MIEMNPLLIADFYKATHYEQYPKKLTKMVSYLTPRMSRIEGWDFLIQVGLQAFCQEFLGESFKKNFFKKSRRKVLKDYKEFLDATLGVGAYDLQKIADLHKLGYVPLEINGLPEGSKVNVKVPMIEITNTHPDFVWLVNTIETAMCTYLWHMMLSANVGYEYRKIVNKYYDISVEDDVPRARALGDFSMRGQESIESATKSSAAFLLSFLNTATMPAIKWLAKYYDCDYKTEPVGYGAISTEHSVMCANFAIDGDEITHVRRLLTEIYLNHNFSMVSDSYDYWYMVDVIIPALKKEILAHNGCISIRGDSGDPVEIVTQTVFHLWNTFGGYINSKGFKVLNPKVKAIYGDSITQERCRQIYEILIANGFACNCVSLGVGSFSFLCMAEDGFFCRTQKDISEVALTDLKKGSIFSPYTRDTFSIAVKATYAEDENGKPLFIFKNPKTDTGKFKKSQKGCCIVKRNDKGFYYDDECKWSDTQTPVNEYVNFFKDGVIQTETLHQIRARLWNNEF